MNVHKTRVKMLTDVQLENAARRLCMFRGIDPDSVVIHRPDPSPDGFIYGIALYSPAWQLAAIEVNNAHLTWCAISLAIAFTEPE